MPEEKASMEHSAEVQEIMGQVPHWILRWGLALLFSIVLLLLAGSYFMQYPVVVNAPFTLTTVNSPAPLVVNRPSRIQHWLAQDGELVNAEQLIAVLENDSRYQDILLLDSALGSFTNQNLFTHYRSSLKLGGLSQYFSAFYTALEEMNRQEQVQHYQSQRDQIQREIEHKESYLNQMEKHRTVKRQEFSLTEKRFRQDSTFYLDGSYGISLYDYETSLRKFLQEKGAMINYEASFTEHEAAIITLNEKLQTLSFNFNEECRRLKKQADLSREKLKEQIDLWKSQHLIVAPRKGRLTFTKYWSTDQVLKAGETLATIVPQEATEIIGRATVSAEGIGKVKKDQMVNIKLSGFPSLEYGTLLGSVRSVSMVPEDNGYVVGIALSNGMTSTYKESLKFIQEMSGTAEIITESKRLLYKLVSP